MKKSKVLIPAMALLLFSTAASITGTVAWFSSTRTFNTSAGLFTVKEIDGNMNVTLEAGIGTTAVKDDNTAPGTGEKATKILVPATNFLIDGSVDHTSGNAYRLSRNPSAAAYFSDYGTASDEWLYRTYDGNNYYVAMSWTMKFTYEFNTETANVGIYLNLKESVFTDTHSGGEADGEKDTALGFRIAFRSDTNIYKVWGNNTAAATSLTYVSGKAQTATTAYTASNYMNTDSGYATIDDATSGATDRVERIGTITTTDEDKSTTVTCIAWFEGTDPNVVSGTETELKTLSAAMSFYARSDA